MNNKRVLKRGGIDLYDKQGALQFIENCEKQNIRIFGVDGFFISDEKTQPSLENSIDFSILPSQEGIYEMAKQLIQRSNDGMYFEIVC
jgi:hypothetical protein